MLSQPAPDHIKTPQPIRKLHAPTRALELTRPTRVMSLVALAAALAATSPTASAAVFGTSATTNFGQRANFGGTTTVGDTDSESDGGPGQLSASVLTNHPRGNAAGSATILPLTPSLRAAAQSNATSDVARGNAALNAAYRYDGPAPGVVSLTYAFDALQTTPAGTDTFTRAQGALLSDVTELLYGVSAYAEGGGTVQDSFSITFDEDDGPVITTSGTLTISVDPGEVFNVFLGLQTSAGGALASVDALNTLVGTLSTTAPGATITLVPEPASLALLALGSLCLRPRRPRHHTTPRRR